jgi:hypothetical protein
MLILIFYDHFGILSIYVAEKGLNCYLKILQPAPTIAVDNSAHLRYMYVTHLRLIDHCKCWAAADTSTKFIYPNNPLSKKRVFIAIINFFMLPMEEGFLSLTTHPYLNKRWRSLLKMKCLNMKPMKK